jgi:CO dehydrogenase maturation factor
MAAIMAVAGKGGVGKTTISALLIQRLSQDGIVLAIDADPATNLNQALGLELAGTVGGIREKMDKEVKGGLLAAGVAKKDFLERRIRGALVETDKIDLIAMGRPEGPGCYCAVNNMLRSIMDDLSSNYDYVVMDCEAGMEHISRQTTRDIDILITVSDPTLRSLTTATAMKELIGELRTGVGRISLVINRVRKALPQDVERMVEVAGFDPIVQISEDDAIYDLEVAGRPVIEIDNDTPLRKGIASLVSILDSGLSRT